MPNSSDSSHPCRGRQNSGRERSLAVVGDGAVGLMAVLAAKQLGAERIVAMSRHAERQKLARFYGAIEIVEERGEAGVGKIKELTGGLGAHSVVEAVGIDPASHRRHPSRRAHGLRRRNYDVHIPGFELFLAVSTWKAASRRTPIAA